MNCHISIRLLLVLSLSFIAIPSFCIKPKWIDNTPKELNYTYKFVSVSASGSSVEGARLNAKSKLQDDTQLQEGIRVYRKTKENTSIDKSRVNNSGLQETTRKHIEIETVIDGEKYDLQAVLVDEYVESDAGLYTIYVLYMVALCDNPVFDRTYLTTSYGFAPVAMSIIPGVGQWYKGSKVKGACMFVAEAASVAGIIVSENNRVSYEHKMIEQPKYAQEYNTKRENWIMCRNVCIGVAAGVWIWGIVDAAVAKGARQVIVSPSYGGGLSVCPLVSPASLGVSFAYTF